MCEHYQNLSIYQNIRHGRSRTKLLRSNYREQIYDKSYSSSYNWTKQDSIQFPNTIVLTDELPYPDSNLSTPDHDDLVKSRLYPAIKSESEILFPLNQISNQYLTSSDRVNVFNSSEFKDSKQNFSRKVTVDSSFGPNLNSSWQHIYKSVLNSDQQLKAKQEATTETQLQGEVTSDMQIQNSFLENSVDDEIEYTSEKSVTGTIKTGHVDIVTRFLRIVESQHLLGENCTAGTHLNLGEGVVDRYAQERFRVEADVAVNRANMLTRIWKYADPSVVMSEYLLHALVFSMVEFDDDIFAGGNCYDQYQYKDYWLFCPYAYRLPEGPILVKDLAVEYKYLSNTSEWFYIARKNAEKVIKNYKQFSRGKYNLSILQKPNIAVYIMCTCKISTNLFTCLACLVCVYSYLRQCQLS